jgi:hypothetical protein
MGNVSLPPIHHKKHMKNTGIVIVLMVLTLGAHAQMTTNQTESKYALISKAKLGISQVELGNAKLINGSLTQLEVLLSRSLSRKYMLEAGIGFAQFNGNDVYTGEYVSYKNNNLRLPVNILYSRDFTRAASFVFGLGAYGIYYARTNMPGYYEGSGAGLNAGLSTQLGAHWKVSDQAGFRLVAEVQRDQFWIQSNQVKFKERMNALISLAFVAKL